MTGGRRDFDFGIGFAVGPSAAEKLKPRLAVTTSQLTSGEGRDSHEKSPRCSALGKSRETVVKQHTRIVRGLSATFFVLSVCFAAAGALAQQFDRDRGRQGQGTGGQGGKEAIWKAWTRALARVRSARASRLIQSVSPQQIAFFAEWTVAIHRRGRRHSALAWQRRARADVQQRLLRFLPLAAGDGRNFPQHKRLSQ